MQTKKNHFNLIKMNNIYIYIYIYLAYDQMVKYVFIASARVQTEIWTWKKKLPTSNWWRENIIFCIILALWTQTQAYFQRIHLLMCCTLWPASQQFRAIHVYAVHIRTHTYAIETLQKDKYTQHKHHSQLLLLNKWKMFFFSCKQ